MRTNPRQSENCSICYIFQRVIVQRDMLPTVDRELWCCGSLRLGAPKPKIAADKATRAQREPQVRKSGDDGLRKWTLDPVVRDIGA
jgi:hypothetical protein